MLAGALHLPLNKEMENTAKKENTFALHHVQISIKQ